MKTDPLPDVCPSCEAPGLESGVERETFEYGQGADATTLTAELIVHRCPACGFQFTGADAEDARHDAMCRHVGVMTPRELRDLRARLGMSQREIAELTRLGLASIKRWESADGLANPANDNLLYLLQWPSNVEALRQRGENRAAAGVAHVAEPTKVVYLKDRFPNVGDIGEVAARAPRFQLRAVG